MDTATFNQHLQYMQRVTADTLLEKAKEYATADRLHNFKAAAALQKISPEAALGGMMAKHTISIYDMIDDTEGGKVHPLPVWEEKIKDSINYLFLLWAMVNENAAKEQSAGAVWKGARIEP